MLAIKCIASHKINATWHPVHFRAIVIAAFSFRIVLLHRFPPFFIILWLGHHLVQKRTSLVPESFLVMFLYRRSFCPIRLKRIKRRPNSSLIIHSLNFLSLHTSIHFCTELVQAESIILIRVFLFYWLVVLGWFDQHQSASVH